VIKVNDEILCEKMKTVKTNCGSRNLLGCMEKWKTGKSHHHGHSSFIHDQGRAAAASYGRCGV
jgi:hypothetical protein